MKIVRGVTLRPPQSLFTVKSLINFQICYPHKIEHQDHGSLQFDCNLDAECETGVRNFI